MAALICEVCRKELQTECCLINGATIMGNKNYPVFSYPSEDGREVNCANITYAQLQEELPFPTKMVVVSLPGMVIAEAVKWSREDGQCGVEKRGYLQHDYRMTVDEDNIVTHINSEALDPERKYLVAIPRNLLAGFTNIRPLVRWAQENAAEMPDDGIFSPAFQLVVGHYAQQIWEGLGEFAEMDTNLDGQISREELCHAVSIRMGKEPSEQLLDTMMDALDQDGDGMISQEEFDRFQVRARRRRQASHASSTSLQRHH